MYLLSYYKGRGDIVFSLVGNQQSSQTLPSRTIGMSALCRVKNDDQLIFINRVGTFGVASASYWWRRAAGIGIRLAHKLLGPERSIEMLIFADDLELLGAGKDEGEWYYSTVLVSCNHRFSFQVEQAKRWLEGGVDKFLYVLHHNEMRPI